MAALTRFIGKFLAPSDFAAYVQNASKIGNWKPKGITVHHTGAPSLAQRPHGFTEQHMLNIKWGYENERGWRSGPHFFVDQNGIWVFVDPSYPGIHAASFNSTHHGLEMLGDYDVEFVNTRVLHHAAVCMRACMDAWGYDEYNFHRDDPKTTKTCPGKRVSREVINNALLQAMPEPKTIVTDGKTQFTDVRNIAGRAFVPVRAFCVWAGIPKSYLLFDENGLHIDGNTVEGEMLIGQVCWAPVSEVAKHGGLETRWDNATKTVTITRVATPA